MSIESGRSVERSGRIDTAAVATLGDLVIGPEHKALPPRAWGTTVREFLDTAPRLDDLQTPVLTLDRGALDGNIAVMAEWAAAAGVRLAPHGKTTMAPRLWAEQLAAGAWGITVATPWQAQVARAFGVDRVLLANPLLDPVGLRWAAAESALEPSFELISWADSVETVAAMDRVLTEAGARVRLPVLVELGGPHGRTGARGPDAARAVAEAVRASERLELAGIGGYEGALAHDRTAESVAALRDYLDTFVRLHRELAGAYERPAIVSAGGSAYPDLVVERLASLADGGDTTVLLRSGAYVIHDDGFYAGITPISGLRSAMHMWARVLSRPEPGLALLDAGKRDQPFDEGLPVPQRISGSARVAKLADQHTFLELSEGGELAVGEVVRLGLSHPCTAMDKWRLVPVVDDAAAERPRVIDLVHTFF
ncbi:alanine racemase [Nocardia sp. NPDC003482]